MATQNQGNANVVYRTMEYNHPTYITRQSYYCSTATGSGGTTGKFYAFAPTIVYGATFLPLTIGTSTYTVNGTSTTSSAGLSAVFVTNTSTSATISLQTNFIGSTAAAATGASVFVVAGTGTAGTNVNVQCQGGLGGFSRYALNTLGGTNTSLAWGTITYTSGYPGSNAAGVGGLYMNPGDALYFVLNSDATASVAALVEFSVAPVIGTVLA